MWRMDFPILITLMSPFSLLGASGGIFQLSMKIIYANRIAPDGTPRFAASHLGLFCLPMSHKKDARLIWVKLMCHVPQSLKFLRHLSIHTFTLNDTSNVTDSVFAIFQKWLEQLNRTFHH